MSNEELNEDTAVEPIETGTMPGVEVPAGAQVPGVNMTDGADVEKQAEEEAPAAAEVVAEEASAIPAVDPMTPVGPN